MVDFVSSLLTEDEVVLGGGMTLTFNAKTRLDKVLPTMWLVANTRILKTLMKVDINFNVLQYLAYTDWPADSPGARYYCSKTSTAGAK